MSQLTADCLNEIFEYLANEKFTLHSCVLVNRLWCEVSVRILWRDVWNYSTLNFSTLVACLPIESKGILCENGIKITTPTSKLPIFNYASFCKVLSIGEVYNKLELLLANQEFVISRNLRMINLNITAQVIINLFIDQITTLKKLEISRYSQFLTWQKLDTSFIFFSKAKDCLKNLSELRCTSDLSPEFLFRLSQISNNISQLHINVENYISNGLTDLISAQKNLKYSNIAIYNNMKVDIISSLLNELPNTLTKLNLYGRDNNVSLLFISKLINLQELQLVLRYSEWFKNFEILQNIIFPQLQILKFVNACPKYELLIKFLENNGKNLKEIYFCEYSGYSDNSLNLAIANFCPKLRKLSIGFKNDELETLEIIFNSCQHLESIKIWCGRLYLNDKEALESVMKYSRNIHEILLDYRDEVHSRILPEELENIFASNMSQRSFSLVVISNINITKSLDKDDENMKIIEEHIKLGIIKRFKITSYDDVDFDPYL
ncbi:hypothetical protein RclHR1_03680006 [Rhizophagus clarus]|uniref:F-box domain-containing protein n=1 Tax=Rhizophagus clarus TaxID=94130 RepID=A0A2Z6RTM4_9GLOM|nr:hypothetical protein RclHR1_03680006 [Rhizophagus clarus]GES76421.1 hypothetical protein GLOIN_2v1876445 [Rhizophagus clarus]